MFLALAGGIGLWVVYGLLRNDIVIIVANSVSRYLLAGILYFKVTKG